MSMQTEIRELSLNFEWKEEDMKKLIGNQFKGLPIFPPQQDPYEFTMLLAEFLYLNPKVAVEIGSCQGFSTWYWINYMQKGGTVISIDDWFVACKVWDIDYNEWWQTWVPEGVTLKTIKANSQEDETRDQLTEYLASQNERFIDFLFIDGDHLYDGVKRDFDLYSPFVKPGGIIALHDISYMQKPLFIEVRQLWDEIVDAGYKTKKISSLKNPEVMGIGIIYIEE
jgi:predicted O-methyltransferase YrrM